MVLRRGRPRTGTETAAGANRRQGVQNRWVGYAFRGQDRCVGWNYEADAPGHDEWHEGYVIPEFADSERGLRISGGDIPDAQIAVEARDDGSYRTRRASEVIGWRAECNCYLRACTDKNQIWASDQLWVRVDSPLQHEPDAFRIYADDAHVIDVGHGDDLEDAARLLWRRDHIDAIDAAAGIQAAAAALRSAQNALDDLVGAARQSGLSWAQIGTAVGVSVQAAYERWAKTTAANMS